MRLIDLHPAWHNHHPMATGIASGLEFSCPKDPDGKRRHSVCFTPLINPYPEFADLIASIPTCACPKWTRTSGERFEDLTLTPSLGSHDYKKPEKPECCHITITAGEILGV